MTVYLSRPSRSSTVTIPVPPQASMSGEVVVSDGEQTKFDVVGTPDDVAAFYAQTLPMRGWVFDCVGCYGVSHADRTFRY